MLMLVNCVSIAVCWDPTIWGCVIRDWNIGIYLNCVIRYELHSRIKVPTRLLPGSPTYYWDIRTHGVAEDIYQGFRVASTTGDQSFIKGNAKYFAFPGAGGGGPILIRPHNTPGRMPSQLPMLTGHK